MFKLSLDSRRLRNREAISPQPIKARPMDGILSRCALGVEPRPFARIDPGKTDGA
jgi:hypothetical protein